MYHFFRILTGIVLLAIFDLGPATFANNMQGYVPPKDRGRSQRTEGAGSRGCNQAVPISLRLLAPNDHVAATVLGHPSFLWYVSKIPTTPMRFTLVEPGIVKPLLEEWVKVDKPGIVQLHLPTKVQELEIGKQYKWSVSIVCNQERPSENIYARAWIERVPKELDLVQNLAAATNGSQRATIYAKSGIWFDAIAITYSVFLAHPSDEESYAYFYTLLAQIGLSQLALREKHQAAILNHQRQNISCGSTLKSCFGNYAE